jgi:putative glycosyltransferase (TIGR04372 family)
MKAVSVLRRSLGFLIAQAVMTMRRPDRIPRVLKHIIILGIRSIVSRRWTDAVNQAYARMPAKWHWKRADSFIAEADFVEGTSLLDENEPKAAWQYFKRCLMKSSDPFQYFVAAICLLVGMGQHQKGLALFTRANALRREKAKALSLDGSRIRFLDPIWAGSIGHLAQTDYLIKLSILEGRSPAETIIYVPTEFKIANRYLFEQWRPYYRVVEHLATLPMPLESLSSLAFDFLAPRLSDGSTVLLWKIAAETYRRWYTESRGPLLSISPVIERRARSVLRSVGIPQKAWFVALHVREAKSNAHHASLHDSLNADVSDYMPAIKEIVRRGGWVIRIGDPAMRPLPPMENVFDYCHSPVRSDWMDIYLLAKCHFLLGTSSGPAYVPPIYGTPSVLTNWWPPAQKPWHPQDIFIPKRIRIGKKNLLTLAQSLEEPFGYCNSLSYLKSEENAIIENNSPDDISSAVIEMFDQIKQSAPDSEEDIALRDRADQIYKSFDIYGMSRLSRDFLRRNENFAD